MWSPTGEPWPCGCEVFHDWGEFKETVAASLVCAVFVDEADTTMGPHPPKADLVLPRQGRHGGHVFYWIGHGAQDLPKAVRTQADTLILFVAHLEDAKILAREWMEPELLRAAELPRGHYIVKRRLEPVTRGRVEWAA